MDERLRRAWAGGDGPAPETGPCPADEEIWAAARGELPRERVLALLEHTRGCPACAESWRMARALDGEMETAGGGRAARTTVPRWIALAAAAVVVLGLVWLVPRPGSRRPPVEEFRAPVVGAVRAAIDEAAPLPRDRFILRWSGPPSGTLYTLEIATQELDVIHRAEELDATEYRVPPEVLAALPAGTVLLWRVDAVLPDTSRVSSPVFRVVVE